MIKGEWRDNWAQLTYQRPHEDAHGVLRNHMTEWDELLKYYRPWVTFVQIGEGSRRMSQPASAQAQMIIRREEQCSRQSLARVEELALADLERLNCNEQWKRRQKNKD